MFLTVFCAVSAALCVVFGALAAYLYVLKNRADAGAATLRESAAALTAERASKDVRIGELSAQCAKLDAEKGQAERGLAAANRQIQMLSERIAEIAPYLDEKIAAEKNLTVARREIADLSAKLEKREEGELELRKKLEAQFETLSLKLLEDARSKMSAANSEQMKLILNPVRETIADFKTRIENLNEVNIKGQAGLEKHIESLVKMNSRLSDEAKNLADALRGENKIAGNWGESVFKRILETCGFKEGVHFRSQESYTDTSGVQKRLVPDFVIDLPENRSIVVDSKLSLVAYCDYCASQTDGQKRENLDKFKKSVRAHLKEFASKYNDLPDARCGFKLMFMPVEPAYELALSADNSLLEDAYAANVLVVGPATVMSVLKYAEISVKNEAVAKNTRQIAEIGARLYERVNLFIERFVKVGDRIRMLSDDYNLAKTTLTEGSKSVVATANRLGAKSGVLALETDDSDDGPASKPAAKPSAKSAAKK